VVDSGLVSNGVVVLAQWPYWAVGPAGKYRKIKHKDFKIIFKIIFKINLSLFDPLKN
jgi:hypothetical protein